MKKVLGLILLVATTVVITLGVSFVLYDELGYFTPEVIVQTDPISGEEIQEYVDTYLDGIEPEAYELTHTENTVVKTEVYTDTDAINEALIGVINQVEKSVIGVISYAAVEEDSSTGSGVIYKLDEDGYYWAITNNHVIENAETIEIVLEDFVLEDAELIARDEDTDLAIIRFQTDEDVLVAEFGSADDVQVGELVVAIGSPSGFTYYNSATLGMVSGVERYIGTADTDGDGYDDVFSKMLQHDTAINPGNSGGPLFNLEGEVIGINTLKLVEDAIEGMGFSIPMDIVERVVHDLEEFGSVQYTRMGILVMDARYVPEYDQGTPEEEKEYPEIFVDQGVLILTVFDDTPASTTSDLQEDDVITHFNGIELEGLHHMKDLLFQLYPGDEVQLIVNRGGETVETSIVLGERP